MASHHACFRSTGESACARERPSHQLHCSCQNPVDHASATLGFGHGHPTCSAPVDPLDRQAGQRSGKCSPARSHWADRGHSVRVPRRDPVQGLDGDEPAPSGYPMFGVARRKSLAGKGRFFGLSLHHGFFVSGGCRWVQFSQLQSLQHSSRVWAASADAATLPWTLQPQRHQP